jgi:hypothetical protein
MDPDTPQRAPFAFGIQSPIAARQQAEAFRSARRLARRHCRGLALHLKAEQVRRGLELARGIISNLEEKGPMNRRQLARCFGNQRWERFEPVVGALTRLGVLVWGADGILEFGEVEISEVEDRLREALIALVPADAGVRKPPAQTPPEPQAENGKKPAGKASKPPGKSK